jgi:hypothetical protein
MTIPDYPWFVSRHGMGWGWAPVSWEGKTVSLVIIAAIMLVALRFGRSRITTWTAAILVALLIAICAVTGTAPG